MKYQFITLYERLPEVLDAYKTTGGYLEVSSDVEGMFVTITTDRQELAYHKDFQKWAYTPFPFRQQGSDFKAVISMLEDLYGIERIEKRDKIEVEITNYLEPPLPGKAGGLIKEICTVIKVGGVEIYQEVLSDEEYIHDKSVLRQFERFIEELKFAKFLRDRPGERHVPLEKQ